jgi:hypothetical protein
VPNKNNRKAIGVEVSSRAFTWATSVVKGIHMGYIGKRNDDTANHESNYEKSSMA